MESPGSFMPFYQGGYALDNIGTLPGKKRKAGKATGERIENTGLDGTARRKRYNRTFERYDDRNIRNIAQRGCVFFFFFWYIVLTATAWRQSTR